MGAEPIGAKRQDKVWTDSKGVGLNLLGKFLFQLVRVARSETLDAAIELLNIDAIEDYEVTSAELY